MQANADLYALPSTPDALWQHYLEHGMSQGRQPFWLCEADYSRGVVEPTLAVLRRLADALPDLPGVWLPARAPSSDAQLLGFRGTVVPKPWLNRAGPSGAGCTMPHMLLTATSACAASPGCPAVCGGDAGAMFTLLGSTPSTCRRDTQQALAGDAARQVALP